MKGHNWRADVVLAAQLCEAFMANEAAALRLGDFEIAARCAECAGWESSIAFSLVREAYGVQA